MSEDTRAVDAAHDISAHAAARERKGRTRPGGRAGDRSGRQAWWKILLTGIGLYVTATLLLDSSGAPELVPTVLVLGAFLPPLSVAAFLYERGALPASLLPILALAFLAGGAIGSVVAQLLEPRLPPTLGLSATLIVGLGEELAKLVAIAWLLGRREYGSMLHGILFGAAAGTGFAAFESMGFALPSSSYTETWQSWAERWWPVGCWLHWYTVPGPRSLAVFCGARAAAYGYEYRGQSGWPSSEWWSSTASGSGVSSSFHSASPCQAHRSHGWESA